RTDKEQTYSIMIVNSSVFAEYIHSNGKYNVKGSTDDLYKELSRKSNGILISASVGMDNSFDIGSKINFRYLIEEYIEVEVVGIFTRILPTIMEKIDLIVDYQTFMQLEDAHKPLVYPDYLMLKIDTSMKQEIITSINKINPFIKKYYYDDIRYENYEEKVSVKIKNLIFGIFSVTTLIGVAAIYSSSIAKSANERNSIMRVLNARGFSQKTFIIVFITSFSIAVIIHLLAGLLVGSLIYGFVILFFDRFRVVEFKSYGSNYQTYPEPVYIISETTYFWIGIMVIGIIIWSTILLIYYRYYILNKANYISRLNRTTYTNLRRN
ncbi:MAG: hypothetical protein KAR35_07990, partial [Candidatus Heimdallarchaeota archaeon]|nr:hypothetical protein [Candidatus Heimdallarchaeota archaeon]MCK5049299.1 hypothetical protein [Candidatus Heimdallarchaeota archaeon]